MRKGMNCSIIFTGKIIEILSDGNYFYMLWICRIERSGPYQKQYISVTFLMVWKYTIIMENQNPFISTSGSSL